MNILFTLCGRAGSKGFKNKNLKQFVDRPLVYYSIAAIDLYKKSESAEENRVDAVLNTDSSELIELVKSQYSVPFSVIERCPDLSGDDVPKVEVIKDCLNKMEESRGIQYDVVVDLDITSPLRTLQDVKNAIERKIENPECDVVYSVTESRRNPYFNMVKKGEQFFEKAIVSEYTARQQAPQFYDMNASIYVYSVVALKNKESKQFFNDKCDAILMKDTGVLDIDSEEDFELMQVIAQYLFFNEKEFGEIYEKAGMILEHTM